MTEKLAFYTNPMSRGRIVRWMLEETGAEYETHFLDYGTTMKAPEYLSINPMGKVPAIKRGETVVTECAAICAYLADAFPAANLAPSPTERGDYYRWLFFAAGPLEAAVANKVLDVTPPKDKQGMVGYGTFDDVIHALSIAVTTPGYIAGKSFTAADLYVGSQIGWGLQFGTIDKRPEFEDYWAKVSDREAYRRANALDDAAMPSQAGA